MKKFKNAQKAFEYYYKLISKKGIDYDDTKALFNVGFYIENPMDNEINTKWRKWKKDYAEYEWEWYLSKDNSVEKIKEKAKIWDKMHNGNNIVNSNYGYQWSRNNQLDYVINELKRKDSTRRAVLTIYDAKEHTEYAKDTPCTLNISFNIINNKLNMNVLMRSNDLYYGFCNDQYCFSKLQQFIANELNIQIGTYFHYVDNMHIYNAKLNLNK
jgi:thymidylate synthase